MTMATTDVVCSTCDAAIPPDEVIEGPNYCSLDCEPKAMKRLREHIKHLEAALKGIEEEAGLHERKPCACRWEDVEGENQAQIVNWCQFHKQIHQQVAELQAIVKRNAELAELKISDRDQQIGVLKHQNLALQVKIE